MKDFFDVEDDSDKGYLNAPNDDHHDDEVRRSGDTADSKSDVVNGEQSEVQGIVENLEHNMGVTHSLDGKAYLIGVSVKMLSLQIEFMKSVIETDELPYEIKRNANGTVRIVPNKMAKYMDLLPSFERLIFDGLALSPDLALYQRLYPKHRISQCRVVSGELNEGELAERYNDFVKDLRAEGERIDIKKLIRQWQRNADENAKRLNVYIDSLFSRYARLMFIRLDLMYRQTACLDAAQAMQWHERLQERNFRERLALLQGETQDDFGDDLPRVDIFTVTEDWRHFKDNMRGKPSLFRHMVGYVCSIEFSSTGGYHLHVALALDGSQVKQHEWLGDMIGQYWVDVTGGRGYFNNCNRGTYKYPGTGLIDHHDKEKRDNLMRTLMYLAKKDQFVRVKPSPKSKTFMTGHLPDAPSGRTGRPRTKGISELSDDVFSDDDDDLGPKAA
jgi:hypothetical protein